MNKKKVLVEISGGVDSAVCAYLIAKSGYEPVAVMMKLHDSPSLNDEITLAENTCSKLGIKFNLLNLQDNFKKNIIDYFCKSYIDGLTPNPCIMCNKTLKFGLIFDYAKKHNLSKIATGHYAQIVKEKDLYELHKAKDLNKDQSYVLHFLDQNRLKNLLLPLGELSKERVRKIANKLQLPAANSEESQDICFIEEGNYKNYIGKNYNYVPKSGDIRLLNGDVVGRHNGLINYTIGQRKGLNVSMGCAMYVSHIDRSNNELIICQEKNLIQSNVDISNVSWISGSPPSKKFECSAKLRYRQKEVPVECSAFSNNKVKLLLKEKLSGIACGQFGVLYDGDNVLGGGTITSVS